MSEEVFAPEVGAAVLARTSMATAVAHMFPNGYGIDSDSVVLDVGDWVMIDGVVESAERFPASVHASMVCSASGVTDAPRRVDAETVRINCDARWVAGVGWDSAIWWPHHTRGEDDLALYSGGVTADGQKAGTTPVQEPAGAFLFYDRGLQEYRQAPAMLFNGTDMMSTRTPTWATNQGCAVMAAMSFNVAVDYPEALAVGVGSAEVIGFTTQDPTQRFGLTVNVRNLNRIELVVDDSAGRYVLTHIDLLAEVDDVVLFGVRYDAESSMATLMYVDDYVNKVAVSAKLRNINGIPAGEALASLEIGILTTTTEVGARVFDVAAWTTPVSDAEWLAAYNAYAELYAAGVREVG